MTAIETDDALHTTFLDLSSINPILQYSPLPPPTPTPSSGLHPPIQPEPIAQVGPRGEALGEALEPRGKDVVLTGRLPVHPGVKA